MNEKNAVVLLSGGMDSTTCLAIAAREWFVCHTLAFDYGQRHRIELEAAAYQAHAFGVRDHRVVRVDLACLGGSALTDDKIVVPTGEAAGTSVPATYVPGRNAVFLSLGVAFAEVIGARDLFIGANEVDFSGYPDCREEFLQAFERMANLGTRMGTEGRPLRVCAPLLQLSKVEIIQRGQALGVDFGHTHTCYDPDPGGSACGVCPSCRIRRRAFADAGLADPARYR